MSRPRITPAVLLVSFALATALCFAVSAGAAGTNWAAPQIRVVTGVGVLGDSPQTFEPQALLTQGSLAAAVETTDAVQHGVADPASPPPALMLTSTISPDATIGGFVAWSVDAPGRSIQQLAFAVDGAGIATLVGPPFDEPLDTRTLTDGPHSLAINVAFSGGGSAIATWSVTVANAPGALLSPPTGAVEVPIAKSVLPPVPPVVPKRTLYRALAPAKPVTIKQLDAALVGYLRLGGAAREIQQTLKQAGLAPRAGTGAEAVARMLGLRLNHPANQDSLELLPNQPATRAEAAWSFAQVLHTDDRSAQSVQDAADAFSLPVLTAWQQRLLQTAISYVGYPYVWGGTSPTTQMLFGAQVPGGFDCSGFVWRVVKLTQYSGEGALAGVLRGRTTYDMSGEVPTSLRIPVAKLQPADVMFFGAHGPASKPNEVDHAALYLGNGWFVQSSGAGVTLLPFDGWYARTFAWARRPLAEAGLS
jgi:cell wall-associated NlpC family hydrolase